MFFKVLITVAAAATLALAQGGGDMGGGGGGMGGGAGSPMGGGMGGGMGRVQKETKADQMVNKLKLNKDQKAEVESILEAGVQEAAQVRQQLGQARGLMAGAYVENKVNDALLKQFTALNAQMIALELKSFQKIYALLKPNQTAKAGEAFDLMAGMFDAQPARGGMRGGMGGMGGGAGRGRGR